MNAMTRSTRRSLLIVGAILLIIVGYIGGSAVWYKNVPYSESQARQFAIEEFRRNCATFDIDCAKFDGPTQVPANHPYRGYRWVLRDDASVHISVRVDRWDGAVFNPPRDLHKLPRISSPPYPHPDDIPKG